MYMMHYPLTLRNMLYRNRLLFEKKEVYSRTFSKENRYTYRDFYARVCRLANVLREMGVKKGDRVGTLAWNNHRHLELYFAVPCSGAVLHTINLRLPREHLIHVINHAEDKVLFVDEDLVPLLEPIAAEINSVKHFVVMSDAPSIAVQALSPVHSYEQLLLEADEQFDFPTDIDENSPAAMCYTSATTGKPKGVVYTHRALFLHSMSECLSDSLALSEKDVVTPVVPMFHVNAWGLPFSAVWMGAKLVLPGRHLDPRSLCTLFQQERVTVTAGVPSIWIGVAGLLESGAVFDLSSLRAVVSGGAPLPRALVEKLNSYGVPVVHAYGMTETTPLVLASVLKSYLVDVPAEVKYDYAVKQGILMPGLEMQVVDENGREIKHDGKQMGELLLRGPWIAGEYFKEESGGAFADGWLHTGDVVTVDEEGYVLIVDRTKDLIKSGGEWISSVELENNIMAHPDVLEAAVIAVPNEKWQERPLACVVLKDHASGKCTEQDILDFLKGRVARWWLPDEVVFVREIPKTGTGKFSKRQLREQYQQGKLGAE